jgi:hypothetical protein
MKKTLLTFTALTALFILGCEKPDSEKEKETTSTDSSQYVSFILNGNGHSNEFIDIDHGTNKLSTFSINGQQVSVGLSVITNDSITTNAQFTFMGDSAGVAAGNYQIGTSSAIQLNLFSANTYYNLVGQNGLVTIEEFPDSVSKYIYGTFNGTFSNNGDSTTFTLTNGKFRVKRTQ